MKNDTNFDDVDQYTMALKKLNKIKPLVIESYNKDKIQEMIDSLKQFADLSSQERYDILGQIIVNLQNIEIQQKNNWFNLEKQLSLGSSLKGRKELKRLSKLIVELDDGVEMMYDLKNQENECVVR